MRESFSPCRYVPKETFAAVNADAVPDVYVVGFDDIPVPMVVKSNVRQYASMVLHRGMPVGVLFA